MHFLSDINVVSQPQPLIYRLATLSDLPAIILINQQTLPENYSLSTWNYLLNFGLIYCAEEPQTQKIVGYCVELPSFFGTDSFSKLPVVVQNWLGNNSMSLIYSIAVLPEWSGQKIGSNLLQICLNATQSKVVLLQARKSNETAQRLYLKYGFQYLLEYLNYYSLPFGQRENAYFMYWQNLRMF